MEPRAQQVTSRNAAVVDPVEPSDSIDLARLVRTVWSYRRFILLATAGVCSLYAAYLLTSYLVSPLAQEASVVFELPFLDDARSDMDREEKYPNGAKFAPDDIVSLPVLQEVYRSNQLSRFGDFQAFRAGFTLTKSSAQLEMLRSEYRSRLAEGRLSAPERARIEQDFAARMAGLLAEPSYQLTYRRRSRRTEMPDVLLVKIVGDVLGVWARQAADRKGVLRSEIVTFAAASLRQDYAAADEPVIAVDLLRTRARRLLENLNSLAKTDGAAATRLGGSGLSLADTRAALVDTVSLRLEPSIGRLLHLGVTASQPRLRSYLEARVIEASTRREEMALRVDTLRHSLVSYGNEGRGAGGSPVVAGGPAPAPHRSEEVAGGGAIPGGSFLDSLLQLSTRRQDQQFRQGIVEKLVEEQARFVRAVAEQEYYEYLLSRLRGPSAGAAVPKPIRQRLEVALSQLESSVQTLWAIHQQLVERNTTPATQLYRIAEPSVVATTDSLRDEKVGLTFAFLVLACLALAPVLCLVHATVSVGGKELA